MTAAVQAAVFDLWNTLVPLNYDGLWARSLRDLAAECGADPADYARAWAEDRLQRDAGKLKESVRRVYAGLGLDCAESEVEKVVARRHSMLSSSFVPRDDAVATLRRLRELGLKTALITNCSSDVLAVWPTCDLAPFVDACVFSCAEGTRKPDRRLYELGAKRIGVATETCIYIGDGDDDELQGAASAGMRPVLLRTAAERVWDGESIANLHEVLDLVS